MRITLSLKKLCIKKKFINHGFYLGSTFIDTVIVCCSKKFQRGHFVFPVCFIILFADLKKCDQLIKLSLWIFKICEKDYKTDRKDEVSTLKFLATAYNYGIDKSAAQIESMVDKFFFNTKLFKTESYSHAEV